MAITLSVRPLLVRSLLPAVVVVTMAPAVLAQTAGLCTGQVIGSSQGHRVRQTTSLTLTDKPVCPAEWTAASRVSSVCVKDPKALLSDHSLSPANQHVMHESVVHRFILHCYTVATRFWSVLQFTYWLTASLTGVFTSLQGSCSLVQSKV